MRLVRRISVIPAAIAAALLLWPLIALADQQQALFEALQRTAASYELNGQSVPMRPIRYFYADRGYLPAWTSPDGLTARGAAILDFLKGAAREGLDPSAYRMPPGLTGPAADIALTAALLRYAIDVQVGRERPERADPNLFVSRDTTDRIGILRSAATESDIVDYLETLSPAAPEYRALRRALERYRVIAGEGGWQPVPGTQLMKPGYVGPEVSALWTRLRRSGDADSALPLPKSYGGALEVGVIRFQRRHGLAPDGIVGPLTRAALNVPVLQRIRQIEINMERWRWMPRDLGESYVMVNLAGFQLHAVRHGTTVLTMPVIVGRPYRKTPVFSDRISYLEVNPDWTVPYSIATKDILPKLRRDPSYLSKNGFQVLSAGKGNPVDPKTINWRDYGPRNFPFLLRQEPGPMNALGQIKFMFPNKYSVYLHDTPARELFHQDVRMFSSGCIRVGAPMNLADFLLYGDPAWTPDRLHREVETGKTEVIRLRKTIPVHLVYITAWATENGTVHFRNDVYHRDSRLMAALYPENK